MIFILMVMMMKWNTENSLILHSNIDLLHCQSFTKYHHNFCVMGKSIHPTMGIYPWNKFRYLTCEILVFPPPELLLHKYRCVIGYIPCCVTMNTHHVVYVTKSSTTFRRILICVICFMLVKWFDLEQTSVSF
jgi:hypothetical protein